MLLLITFVPHKKQIKNLELFIIISLLAIGWLLVFLEVFFVPGITVLGIIGGAMMLAGFYYSFSFYGNSGGWMTIGITSVFMITSIFIGFKAGLWNKLSLKQSLEDSRMNEFDEAKIKAGDMGIAVSRIALSGTARFNEVNYEVNSESDFINANTTIEIVRIENRKIIVQTKK